MVKKAADQLASATTAAEVLDARDQATVAYTAAKLATRLQKAKKAHDEIVVTTARAQANALEIEVQAKRRLADEYDAAQKRGEVQKHGRVLDVPDGNIKPATAEDIFGKGGRK